MTVGGSDWILCSAFVLSSRIIYTTWVYPLTLYPPFFGFYFFNGLMFVLQALHVFWAGLILRMVIKFLPGNVRTTTFECFTVFISRAMVQFLFIYLFFFKFWQDIVEDERSDKEETESEDEDDEHEQREKSKNGHVQNGHTVLNNNHRKTD